MVGLLILISIFITSCGNLYLEFNSDGIYETPMMRYEIKQVEDKLHIKMANISGDTVMKCDFIFFFQNDDNETVATTSYISSPMYAHYWKTDETFVKIPPNATKVYIRYNEYNYYATPIARYRDDHDYNYFSTIYMRLLKASN